MADPSAAIVPHMEPFGPAPWHRTVTPPGTTPLPMTGNDDIEHRLSDSQDAIRDIGACMHTGLTSLIDKLGTYQKELKPVTSRKHRCADLTAVVTAYIYRFGPTVCHMFSPLPPIYRLHMPGTRMFRDRCPGDNKPPVETTTGGI